MKMVRVGWALLALVGACSPAQTMGVVDSGTEQPVADSGVEVTPDAGGACENENACAVSWKTSADYPVEMDHHSSFVLTSDAGTFVYAAGGVKNHEDTLDEVWAKVRRAKIADDGSLGAWVDGTDLDIPIGFQAFAQSEKHVYLMAGISKDMTGFFAHDRVLVGTVQADGDITWVRGASLGLGALHGTGAVLNDTLYLIGGTGNQHVPQSLVMQAKIKADGTLEPWAMGAALPLQRSHHVAFVYAGHVYVAGGFDLGNNPISDVLRSVNDPVTGAITGWSFAGELPDAPWTSGAAVVGDYVYLIGGGQGGPGAETFTDRVRRARILPDGALQAFEDVQSPLPMKRAHVHQAPTFNGRFYSVGGREMTDLSSIHQVFIGTLGLTPGG